MYGGNGFGILASGTAISRFVGNTVASSKYYTCIIQPLTSLMLALLHAGFHMSSDVYEMFYHFSYVIELLCYLICLSLSWNFLLPLTVASAIPVFSPSSNRTQLLTGQSAVALMPLNASATREYTCSGALYGRKPNEASCIDAIRQLDGRDGKEQVWKQRGWIANYDIGLPRSYWSCKSEGR